ncbi:MAG: dienelactone hydrolase family protein [Planctomycetota bacterium]|jgi:pimeloyl-ACP methyl ester carboxylesterase
MRLAFALLLATATVLAGPDRKQLEAFGVKWWKARPKNKFHRWDPAVRQALLEEAAAFGPLPEGSLEKVRDALWKSVKKYGPSGGRGKLVIKDHGYESEHTNDKMWANVKGAGKGKGLVMSLHGGGEGAGGADTNWSLKGCMTIGPQGLLIHGDNWNRVHGEKQILSLIEIAKAQWDVDPDRVFVMGFSMGGTGSWHMAGRFPDLFAGAAPCNGVIMANPVSQLQTKEEVQSIQYGLLPNVYNLPIYFCTGSVDKNCRPGTFLYAWDEILELRKEYPEGFRDIRFEYHEGVAHAFGPGQPGKALKWLAQQKRNSFPQKLVWLYAANPHPLPDEKDTTRRYQKHTFYWIRHDHPADRMEIIATRDGNEFDVSLIGAEAEGLYVMLNPQMIDVKEEVVVRLEGKEVYRGKPVPDVRTIVESLDSKLDKTLTFDRRAPCWK